MQSLRNRLFPKKISEKEEDADKNFGLSQAEFEEMVVALKQGKQDLFERIYLAQFAYCRDKLRQFDGLSEQESYDATMEAMLYFRDLLIRDKVSYGNLRFLFVKIARQRYARRSKKQPMEGELKVIHMNVPEGEDYTLQEDMFEAMDRAFRALSKECRSLLHEFYHNRRSLQELAEDEATSYPTLRKQKSRCVQRMRLLLTTVN